MSQVLWETLRRVKETAHSRVPIELALVKLAQGDGLRPLGEVVQRLQALEAALGAPRPRASAAPSPAPERPAPRRAAPAAQKKKRPAPAPVAREAGSRPETSYEQMLASKEKLEKQAQDNPVIREALRILEGTIVNLEK
jgi:hypothetical protein